MILRTLALGMFCLWLLGCTPPQPEQVETLEPTQEALGPSELRDCADCPHLIVIPAGTFTMGSPPTEATRLEAESPQHNVTIARPFAIGRTEITLSEFAAFARETGFDDSAGCHVWTGSSLRHNTAYSWRSLAQFSPNEPVSCISAVDAEQYVSWLSAKTEREFRLPSEAEWEYATRGLSTTARPWGEEISASDANFNFSRCLTPFLNNERAWTCTAPVSEYEPNAFGVHDMLGNVWEWTSDCWHANYEDAPIDGSSWRTGGDCRLRPIRGGSWLNNARALRSAARDGLGATQRYVLQGFRVARSLTTEELAQAEEIVQ